MDKIEAVEQAKALMTTGMAWSILKWLAEKRKVRAAADRGTAALDDAERSIKAGWCEELKLAYAAVSAPADDDADPFAAAEREFASQQAQAIPDRLLAIARRVRDADEAATRARLQAEATFDDAERKLSASMARRGAEEAIAAYDLRYRALDEAKSAILATQSAVG